MRTLLVALVLVSADAGQPPVPGRAATYVEARRAFAGAYRAGALDEARSALARARAAASGRLDLDYDLACLEVRDGHRDRAFALLEVLAAAGLAVEPVKDPDLDPLHADTRWAPGRGCATGASRRRTASARRSRARADGTLYAADARAGTVYRLRPGSAALDPLVPEHTFASPQTPALAADGRTLFVPDWTLGLFAVPLSGGSLGRWVHRATWSRPASTGWRSPRAGWWRCRTASCSPG